MESCGKDLRQAGVRRHVDHIVPARLIRRLKAGNADRPENLQSICGTCHGYKLQADHKLCLGDKLGYLEIRSQNELTRFGYAKDYDAIVTVRTDTGDKRFALEYERTPKAAKFYRAIAASIAHEANVDRILYLASNYDLLRFVSTFFMIVKRPVYFGLVRDWHEGLLDMRVSQSAITNGRRLRDVLGAADLRAISVERP